MGIRLTDFRSGYPVALADLLLGHVWSRDQLLFFFKKKKISFAAFSLFTRERRANPSFFSLFLLREQKVKNPKCSSAAAAR